MKTKKPQKINNFLIYNIEEVDDFVLKFIDSIRKSSFDCDLTNVKRSFYEIEPGINGLDEIELTEDEYILPTEYDKYSILNYEEFKSEFPIDLLDGYYDELCHHLISNVFELIDKVDGDDKTKLYITDLLDRFKASKKALLNINCYWFDNVPLHSIQKKVIAIHIDLNDFLIIEVQKRYKNFLSKKNVILDYEVGFKLNIGYGNHTKVLDLLEAGGFVKKGTSKGDFITAFNSVANKKVENPIIWMGTKKSLHYFISNLKNKEIINLDGRRHQKHWKTCDVVFRDKYGDVITNIKFNHRKAPKMVDKISLDNIISQFKVQA